MKAHELVHFDERPFDCVICFDVFQTWPELRSHMDVHSSNVRRYQCPHCAETFKAKRSWNRHIQLHTGKRFACRFCNKAFQWAHSCRKHENAHNRSSDVPVFELMDDGTTLKEISAVADTSAMAVTSETTSDTAVVETSANTTIKMEPRNCDSTAD